MYYIFASILFTHWDESAHLHTQARVPVHTHSKRISRFLFDRKKFSDVILILNAFFRRHHRHHGSLFIFIEWHRKSCLFQKWVDVMMATTDHLNSVIYFDLTRCSLSLSLSRWLSKKIFSCVEMDYVLTHGSVRFISFLVWNEIISIYSLFYVKWNDSEHCIH